MISGKIRNVKKRPANHGGIGEITFPPLSNVGSSDPVIIKVYISGRQVNRVYLDGRSSCEVIYEHCRCLKLKTVQSTLQYYSNTPLSVFLRKLSCLWEKIPLEFTIVMRAPSRTSKAKEEKLSPGKNAAVHNQVEELTEAGILREVKEKHGINPHCRLRRQTENEATCRLHKQNTARHKLASSIARKLNKRQNASINIA
ncbi:hypothetical protein Tco_0718018 [Tanacetum coccineum]